MKLVPINMDHCLLQFEALKFLQGVCPHGGSLPTFTFFQYLPPNLTTKSKSSPLKCMITLISLILKSKKLLQIKSILIKNM